MAPDGNIYWPGECGNLATCGGIFGGDAQKRIAATFLHEMVHVWQHQQGINVMLRGAIIHTSRFLRLLDDPYVLPLSVPFNELNIEQQGQYFQHRAFPGTVKTKP